MNMPMRLMKIKAVTPARYRFKIKKNKEIKLYNAIKDNVKIKIQRETDMKKVRSLYDFKIKRKIIGKGKFYFCFVRK